MSNKFENKEFFAALAQLVEEKGIPADYMFEKIQAAIISATRNQFGNRENVVCDIDKDAQTIRVYVRIPVMEEEEIEEPAAEWTVEQAVAHGFESRRRAGIQPRSDEIRPDRGADRKERHPPGHPRSGA